jgi:hypothetical protein
MARLCETSRAFRKAAAEPPVFQPSAADVVAAVESLYADEVRPHGRILLKRLGERAASEAMAAHFATVSHRNLVENVPRIDANRLRKVCERSRQLRVEVEESGEYCALLVGRRETFVDASVNVDGYPEQLWLAASAFFAGPLAAELVLPGGRYACAQALMNLGLPFLAGLSLGRVCHVVQLAISKRRILGYLNGQVVPYCRSEAVVKEFCAQQQKAAVLGPRAVPALPLATLEQARSCLSEMLSGEAGEPVSVPLPNVKRIFRSRFNLDLSETALGQSRLCELLQDPRFRDVCAVQLQGNGYVVVRAERARAPASPESWPAYLPAACEAPALQPEQETARAPSSPETWPTYGRSPAPRQACVPPSPETWPTYQLKLADRLARPVAATFAPGCAPPPCLPPAFYGELPGECAPAPPAGAPSCESEGAWEVTCQALGLGTCAESDSDATESTAEGSPEHRCDESFELSEEESPHCLLQWPSEWAVGDVLEDEFDGGRNPARSVLAVPLAEPLAGPLAERLGMESELALQPSASPLILQDGHWSPLMSPSVLADDCCIGQRVKNTFVHLSPTKATPSRAGARRRARSVPKDAGSAQDAWEPSCDTVLFKPDGVASPTYVVPSPALAAAAASRPRVCWSPGSPSDASVGIAETLRLWNCTPSRPGPSPRPSPAKEAQESGWCTVPERRRAKAPSAQSAVPWRTRQGAKSGAASPAARRAGA